MSQSEPPASPTVEAVVVRTAWQLSRAVVTVTPNTIGKSDLNGVKNVAGEAVNMTFARLDTASDTENFFKDLSTLILPSSTLLLTQLLPSMFHSASHHVSTVFHVSLNDEEDLSDLLTTAQTGFCILHSYGDKETYYFTLIAHLLAWKFKVPVLHFFEGDLTANFQAKAVTDIIAGDLLDLFNSLKAPASDTPSNAYLKTFLSVDPNEIATFMSQLRDPLGGYLCQPVDYFGPPDAQVVIVCMGTDTEALMKSQFAFGIIKVHLYRPWSLLHFLKSLPRNVKHIAVLEHYNSNNPWTPLFLDVAASVSSLSPRPTVHSIISPSRKNLSLSLLVNRLTALTSIPSGVMLSPPKPLHIPPSPTPLTPPESAYLKLLGQVFHNGLRVVNAFNFPSVWGDAPAPTSIHHTDIGKGLGVLLEALRRRRTLFSVISNAISSNKLPEDLTKSLSEWKANFDKSAFPVNQVVTLLERHKGHLVDQILEHQEFFSKTSNWLIGNDRWATDLGNSGIHAALASGEKVKLLILDTDVYSQSTSKTGKKDIGLYAMNYGNAYVASIAIYGSYTQAYQALVDAERFDGPAIVIGYAPDVGAIDGETLPVSALIETKRALDSGTWPLYRWNPTKSDAKFTLDSDKMKKDVEEFLQKDNQLSLFIKEAEMGRESMEAKLEAKHHAIQQQIVDSFAKLSAGLGGPELLILYGSDGGNAEGVARRVFEETQKLGARPIISAMNDFPVEDLPKQRNVIFVVSTAGQGEFPTNAREFWKQLTSMDFLLDETSFTVFAMGDRNYWPRPEEAIYFCKCGRDLDLHLGNIGGNRLVECGVGDDQDPDGFETGFQLWFPKLLEAFNLGTGTVKTKKAPNPEEVKKNSNFLRGTIKQGLEDTSTGALCVEDTLLTKFHGIYQQDDRDLREDRRKKGMEKAFIFMARIRVPGGICTPKQWLTLDEMSDRYCNGTIKITTRQAIQYHGIIKKNLKKTIAEVNYALMDTLAACGDVNRNVMCNPNPYLTQVHEAVYKVATDLSAHLTPNTSAYHEIWLDKKPVAGNAVKDVEPLYGETYLPRKFKVAIAIPPHNDVDVYCHDLGYIAVINDKGGLDGFNVVIGGGMGMTHNNTKTYPCLGSPMAFCTVDQAIQVGEKVMLVQKEYGDRSNRKHARLKYTLEDRGMPWFRDQVETKLGYKLADPVPFKPFTTNGDTYGWTEDFRGQWHLTLFIEHGRVRDTHDYQLRTALREVAQIHEGDFRFTGNQNIIIGNVKASKKKLIEETLAKYGVRNERWSVMRLNSMACTALPTCGLAFAESERYLPRLVTLLEKVVESNGLRNDAIHIRMSGCPNGCSRPFVGEIALVGRAPGIYNLYLGGGFAGERLNKLFKESVNEQQIVDTLAPMIEKYAKERKGEEEHFGDFVIRAGIIKATTAGRNFHVL